MSSPVDPAKLKVVELRAELTKRGLESKGNKPALVKRLKEALEDELKEELPDTSIADTSTEELNSSQNDEAEEQKLPDKEVDKPPVKEQVVEEVSEVTTKGEKPEVPQSEPPELEEPPAEVETQIVQEPQVTDPPETEELREENKENGQQEDVEKSQWSEDVEFKESEEPARPAPGDSEPKGEKRRHSSPSPDRSQRRRSKSPIKEDEPAIDNDKVQLSWYDSDLHLQLDKESFLSAKPYHDGAFGFAWAGVRATHGVKSGKVCFEVKITEELKWDDFSKYYDKHRRDQHKSVSKHKSDEDKKKSDEDKKKGDEDKKKGDEDKKKGDEDKEKSDEDKKKSDEDKKKSDEDKKDDEDKKKSDVDKKDDEDKNKSDVDKKDEEDKKKSDEDTKNKDGEKQENGEKSENLPENESDAQESTENEKPEEGEKVEAEEEAMETDAKEEESKEQPETKEQTEPLPTHLFRVGWSLIDTDLQLGEDKFSYGYESSGKFVANKQFEDYGIKFGVGDVISSFLNIDESGATITYSVNGVSQSEAIKVGELPDDFVLFPHVLSRNYAFELNLGSKEEAWFAKPEGFEDFEFLDKLESRIPGPVRPENRSDCEVILMCGLPAAGKTHWVREYVESNPEKKYTLLGNTHLLEKMTVSGDTLKSKYKGSWNILLDKLQKSLNKLVEIASARRRNYIIDQTNVFPSAQRRKLRPFEGFKRRAVVVIVGDEEQAKRKALQEAQDGKDVPDSAILEMKANMSLPQKGDWLDEVIYVGMTEEEANSLTQKYNTQGREAGFGIQRRFGHRDDRHKWQNRRNDYRAGNYRERNYQNNRYDRGPPRQNWHPQRPGGWNRDRRDNRAPPSGGSSRDWRNRGNGRDRSRDSQVNTYNRNRNPPGRSPGGGWQSGGGGGGGGWSQSQGSWGTQPWGGQGSWGQSGWSSQNQNQWKYGGGGQNYGGYSNWNYYGQYAQGWNPQGTTASPSGASGNQYGQYSQQQWAQYAQQYAQQGQIAPGSTTQSTSQK